ncbi:MAG TPA: isocitrate lyase/phosphoenolpyruvate mutase family protein [Candidatus Binatia bacterium]|jgi:2-methylisocitrate lyase-like PEP mutase family enzyme
MTSNADLFRQLHSGPDLLMLPNCWDAGSARLLESLGARAVATTSAGLDWSRGYPDGNHLPVAELVAAIRAIARVIDVPLTVDMEAGYSNEPGEVGDTVAAVVDAGAVGINLEDGTAPAELLARKIAAARRAAEVAGVALFINARTDVYLKDLAPEDRRLEETLARATMYRDAGADGLFVPKLTLESAVREVAARAKMPLNVLLWPGLARPARLRELGVRRLSSGAAIAQAAWTRARTFATAFLAGEEDPRAEAAVPTSEINALLAQRM